MQAISHEQVESVLHMEELIPLMRETMIEFSKGSIEQPPRRILPVTKHAGYFGSMPAVSGQAVGAKLVSFYPGNDSRQLPTHMAKIVLFQPETGEPLAILDGGLITEMRTAAVSAAFVDAVADDRVRSLAVIGAGVQARSHLQALGLVRQFDDIRICNRNKKRADELAASVNARVVSNEEAVRDADVVVTATASTEPVFDGAWLKPGARVISVGWAGADAGELDQLTMSQEVVVDSIEGAMTESGNVRRYQLQASTELGEVLAGEKKFAAQSIVVFESIGMACQDLASATMVLGKLAGETVA